MHKKAEYHNNNLSAIVANVSFSYSRTWNLVRFKWPVIHSNIIARYNKKHKAVMLQHRPISAHGTMAMQGNV